MSWSLLAVLVLALGTALVLAWSRRSELAHMRGAVKERERAVRQGSDQAQLQHPIVDLSRCLGCGSCVAACPEDGVLAMVHGQAAVVNAARCVGHAACERECPVGAITVTLANLEERDDIPVIGEGLEAVGVPGLFLAGEVTAHALIKTAIEHGTSVAAAVAACRATSGHAGHAGQVGHADQVLDLCIVGAGPAGLACSLEARRQGLAAVTLEQEAMLGGTVAKYPRRKLVLTQPVELPLHGRMRQTTYTKEELVELWQDVARQHQLPIRTGALLQAVQRQADDTFLVRTTGGDVRARNVCLALGRRGVPRKLGVPGEDLSKVAYSLMDASSYQGRRVLVVGGGDSAVETALGLAEQPGNRVTLSYRQGEFFRIRSRNEERLEAAVRDGHVRLLLNSEVTAILPQAVLLDVQGRGPAKLPNDEVFIMVGGTPPFDMLRAAGVSFDPKLRPTGPNVAEQGTGLLPALIIGFGLALAALVFALWHVDYYGLPLGQRPAHDKHLLLRPGMGLGLGLGFAAAGLIVVNLLYLLRRSPRFGFAFGSLKLWMTSHVATGILALLCAMLHCAMSPRDTVGGQAFWVLAVLLLTGAIGRYFYSYVPRAVNGRELELGEVRARLSRLTEEMGKGEGAFGGQARAEVSALIERRQWRGSFLGRLLALIGVQFDLRRALRRLRERGREQGVHAEQVQATLALAQKGHRAALMAAHFEDLRALLNSWRFLHRWAALLMVLLVIVHVVHALTYGAWFSGGGVG